VSNDQTTGLIGCVVLSCLAWGLCGSFLGARSGSAADAEPQAPTLREIRIQKLPASILALDLAGGLDLAATALSNRQVLVWRLDSEAVVHDFTFPEPETDPRQRLESDTEPIRVRFSPDGTTLGISHLSRIHLYAVSDWREITSLGIDGEDTARARPKPRLGMRPPPGQETDKGPGPSLNQLTTDLARLFMRGDGRTRITDFKFTPDGRHILAAYCKGGCYDSRRALRLGAFPSGNDPVRLWDLRTGRLLWEHSYDPKFTVEKLAVSGDGTFFAAVQHRPGECRIEVHNLRTGETLYSLPQIRFAYSVPGPLFTPDGHFLITMHAEDGTQKRRPWEHLAMYEVSAGELVAEFSGRYAARNADLSPDGRWLATSWNGVRFQIWNVQTRTVVATKSPREWLWSGPPIESVRFSPDGQWLTVASDSSGELAVYRFGS
jgi:WD40 repeat protein